MAIEAGWISCDARLPRSGQTVEARALDEAIFHIMKFYAEPVPRWEGANFVFQREYFSHWRPLDRKSS